MAFEEDTFNIRILGNKSMSETDFLQLKSTIEIEIRPVVEEIDDVTANEHLSFAPGEVALIVDWAVKLLPVLTPLAEALLGALKKERKPVILEVSCGKGKHMKVEYTPDKEPSLDEITQKMIELKKSCNPSK
jgi:hypothetical protein